MKPLPSNSDILRWEDDGGNSRRYVLTWEDDRELKDLVYRVMEECDRRGIAWGDFHAAVLREQRGQATGGTRTTVEELYRRSFRRLKAQEN